VSQPCRAYIDIETTGLSAYDDDITVVGICVEKGRTRAFTQLYEGTLTRKALLGALRPAVALYSYNGASFDLPFIREHLRADLAELFEHYDLMHHCHRRNLYGGLKAVERKLRIQRKVTGVEGYVAVQLWHEYRDNGNERALKKLLKYNEEDVRNLIHLRRRLGVA
jgi:uncharacterized protein YprB with RNaseH-like and TPR domain